MKSRISDKIKEIENYIKEFETIIPCSLSEYKSNLTKKAACERYFEKIIEALTDLAFLIIKYKKLSLPEDDKAAFQILNENKVINNLCMNKMKLAKGMRNLIIHQYDKVDDEIVFEAITAHLISDVNEFIGNIEKSLK